jgi:hypothetical protein
VGVSDYYGYSLVTADNSPWTIKGSILGVGATDATEKDGAMLTIRNGSRVVGTNAELRLQRGVPAAGILVTGPNSLLRVKTLYVSGSSGNRLAVNNHGAILTVSNGATVASASTCFVYSNGILRLSSGTFSNATTLGVVGKLEGSGTIVKGVETGNWPGGGTVRPGGSNGVGRLNIGNTFQQISSSYGAGRLELEIGGTAPGTGYDVLNVTNGITIAKGPIVISALPAFKIPGGISTFDVMTGSSISTSGATLTLPPNVNGIKWSAALANIAGGRKALRVTVDGPPMGSLVLIQ